MCAELEVVASVAPAEQTSVGAHLRRAFNAVSGRDEHAYVRDPRLIQGAAPSAITAEVHLAEAAGHDVLETDGLPALDSHVVGYYVHRFRELGQVRRSSD